VKLLPGDGKGTYTRVAVTVTNTGKCEGEEVVQSLPPSKRRKAIEREI